MLKERAIALSTATLLVTSYNYVPKIRKIVDQTLSNISEALWWWAKILYEGFEFAKDNELLVILIWWAIVGLWEIIVRNKNSYKEWKKFKMKNYEWMLNISIMYIDWNEFEIETDVKVHLSELFEYEPIISKNILDSSRKTTHNNSILKFKDEDIAWWVYNRLRSHIKLFWGRIDATKRAKRSLSGNKEDDNIFIGVLTKEPQYKIINEDEIIEVERKEIPNTKSQVRLSVFPEIEIQSAIEYLEYESKENGIDIYTYLAEVWEDKNGTCPKMTKFIAYMLDLDSYKTITHKEIPLKSRAHRIKFSTFLQVVNEYLKDQPLLRVPF